MRKIIYFCIIFIVYPFFAKADDEIIHKPYSERQPFFVTNFYNNPINQDSTRYFKEIHKLKTLALKNNDRELYLETVFMRLNFLSSRKYENYIREIKQLIQTADNENILQLQIRTRQALGFHYFYELSNYGKAIFYFLNSYEYIKKIEEVNFPEKQEALSNIANICYNAGYENKALKFIKEAKKYNYKHAPALIFNLMNTEGLIYQKYRKLKEAKNIFNEILRKATDRSDTPWQLIATGKLATIYCAEKKYNDALKLLDNCPIIDTNRYNRIHYEDEVINHSLLYAEIYLQKGDTLRFNETVKKLSENSALSIKDLKMKQRLFFLFYKYYSFHNHLKKSILYSDSLIDTQKKIDQIIHTTSIKIAVEKNNYNQYVKIENTLKIEKQRNKRIKFTYISVSLLLLLLIIFIYVRKRKQYKTKITSQNVEIKKAQLYLDHFIANNRKKDQIINELSEKITITNKQSLLDMMILTDDDWITFKREFTILHPYFFDKLRSISPKITPALERLSALLYIGLDNSQIANTLGIGKDSVSRTKRRLKEYLQIPTDTDFKIWFESK